MTKALWRIAVQTQTYRADDISGIGAKITGGRWNSEGTAMLYSASNIALAMLETLSHARLASLPLQRFLVRLDVPDAIWAAREQPSKLPDGWDALPCGVASVRFGDAWIKNRRSALLVVPSVIVPDECNVLLNPSHPDVKKIRVRVVKPWRFDPRLL